MKIEVAEPGKENLPSNIQSLALVSRVVDGKYSNQNADTLQKLFLERDLTIDTVLYDTEAVDTLLKALGNLLYESGRYDIVIPENRFLPFKSNGFFSEMLPWDEAKTICDTFHTDAVLSLDVFKTSLSSMLESASAYDEEYERFIKLYFGTLAVEYIAYFRVYDPYKQKQVGSSYIRDTLIWQEGELSKDVLSKRLVSLKKAITETSIAAALTYSDKISNRWHNETRKYYSSGSPELIDAYMYTKINDWPGAMEIWGKVAETTKQKGLRSKAEYNMALGYEMSGDIEEAIRWGLRSYKTMYRPLTYEYLEILKQRKAEIAKYSDK
jgi:tetratricopeptide (TPR) repeat protein